MPRAQEVKHIIVSPLDNKSTDFDKKLGIAKEKAREFGDVLINTVRRFPETDAPGLDIHLLHDSADPEKIEADTGEFKIAIGDLGEVHDMSEQEVAPEQLAA
ncbi:hypothetical protein KC939_00495 [Candidatus Saccharibacteria bacterium]|nr:hypothetical protein [Candidatus Saccharibacteria bacterium]